MQVTVISLHVVRRESLAAIKSIERILNLILGLCMKDVL